jgi:signal transduction histidine kinase
VRLHRHLGLMYGILVALIVVIGAWWVFYLTREGHHYESFQLQRFRTDQMHAVYILETVPEVRADPAAMLGKAFPHLLFRKTEKGWEVSIDPAAAADVHREAARRRRMFMTEGVVFLLLLAAGTTILTLASRRERDFKRARELFLAGATHEFKTPLASIRLYTETLQRPDLPPDAGLRIRGAMLQDVERLEAMMEQVLSVSRDEDHLRGARETLDLADVTRDVLEAMGAFLEDRGARLDVDVPAGHLVVGDRQALRVAVRNLVHNAVHYSPPPAQVSVTLYRDGNRHRLTVRDRGPGIPRREQKRVFESFYRAETGAGSLNERPRGSGLGLYLVQRNVESLGGRVELESEEGRGAAFTLVLPASAEETR